MSPTQAKASDPFADLQIVESDEPLPSITRGGHTGPNPFTTPLLASVENDTAYSFYIAPGDVQRAVFLINAAAKRENKGVRVWVDVQRDNGKVVKGKDGKAIHNVQQGGPNRGKVLVRFQGKAERKTQTAPRPYSIVKDKSKDGMYYLRRRADKVNLMYNTHAKVKAEYTRLTTDARNAVQAQQAS